MTSEVDTREVEERCRKAHDRLHCLARSDGAGMKSQAEKDADAREAMDACWRAAQAIAQERAARERAEAETKKWKEVAAREWERARKAETMLAQARQP